MYTVCVVCFCRVVSLTSLSAEKCQFVCISMYICIRVYILVCICIYTYTFIYINIHTHLSVFEALHYSSDSAEKVVSISSRRVFHFLLTRWFIMRYRDEVGKPNRPHYRHRCSPHYSLSLFLLLSLSLSLSLHRLFSRGLFVCVCRCLPHD